jgi:hypothetical protein
MMFRKRYFRRMYDLSQFMSTLKQRFSIWYNHGHERHGPLPSPGALIRAKHDALTRGWIFGGKDFVERMAGRRPTCFRAGGKGCATPLQRTGKVPFFTARFA